MKNCKFILIAILSCVFTSCGVVCEFLNSVADNANNYFDQQNQANPNGGPRQYSNAEACAAVESWVRDTKEVKSIESGYGGIATVVAKVGVGIFEDLTHKDCSLAKNILDATMDDLSRDKDAGNNTTVNVISTVLYTLGETDRAISEKKRYEANDAYNRDFWERNHEDPFFDCKYAIEEPGGRFVDIAQAHGREGLDYVLQCIEEVEAQMEEEYLRQAIENGTNYTMEEYMQLPLAEQEKIQEMAYQKYDVYLKGNEQSTIDNVVPIRENNESSIPQIAEKNNDNESTNVSKYADKQNAIDKINSININTYKINTTALNDAQKEALDSAAILLNENPDLNITITGHTCDMGYAYTNKVVGQKRADAAKKYLVKKGVAEERIETLSVGKANPIVPNNSGANRLQNRCVTFEVK